MISSIRSIANPKTFVLTAMLSAAAISGGTALKAQTQDTQRDIVILHNKEVGETANLNKFDNLGDVKKGFNTLIQKLTIENAWKGMTRGINLVEYLELEGFLRSASSHENSKISEWSLKKLDEMEHLKNSDYNKKTLNDDIKKSQLKVDKYEKQLEKLKRSSCTPPNFLMLMFYAEDYQKISDQHIQEQKYCERDIAYYKCLNIAELNNVLSSASVKKFKAGKGKKVK